MKKTSRRSFGKQLTGALAAISVGSVTGESVIPTPTPQKPHPQSKKRMVTHDTPPPTDLMDGSLAISSFHALTRESNPGGRWVYDRGVGVDAGIAHIRVSSGNGEIIYQNLDADGSTITVELEDTNTATTFADLIISVAAVIGGSVFRIDSSHRLPHQHPTQGTKRRPFKYDHPGPGSNHDFRVSKITVSSPRHQFTVTAPDAADDTMTQEYRVMIWHVGD